MSHLHAHIWSIIQIILISKYLLSPSKLNVIQVIPTDIIGRFSIYEWNQAWMALKYRCLIKLH